MGEVYRAHDTTLDPEVARKVLPQAFTDDPDRLPRFEREAKVLASLNHPNIAAIYGIEETEGAHAEGIEHEAVDREKALRGRGGYEFAARVAALAGVGQRGNGLLSWNQATLHRGLAK